MKAERNRLIPQKLTKNLELCVQIIIVTAVNRKSISRKNHKGLLIPEICKQSLQEESWNAKVGVEKGNKRLDWNE